MLVADIVLDIPTRAIDSTFTYIVPSNLDVQIGQCVEVEFSHRPSIGYVMDISECAQGAFGDISLLPVLRVLTQSYFDKTHAQLAYWIAHEYLSTLPEAVKLLMPPGATPRFRNIGRGEWRYEAPTVAAVDDRWVYLTELGKKYVPRKTATKQIAVVEALKAGAMRVAELGIDIESVSTTLRAMEKRGLVKIEKRRRVRGGGGAGAVAGAGNAAGADNTSKTFDSACTERAYESLTQGQKDALEAIHTAQQNSGGVVVVDGVTGSGKTEVYLQAIRDVLALGKTACVLVPEISLTPQTVGRFRSRFGDMVAVLHSRLSVGERYDQWDRVRQGDARVVVGARSALFAPLQNVGLIVIDEEHESSYKQGSSPRYSSRDVANKLAQLTGAVLVLGSASPAIETLYNCQTGTWQRVELHERASGRPLPPVQIVDLSNEFEDGNRTMYSRALTLALQQTIERGEKAVLLLNRRGFASFLLCRQCGFVPECEQCSTSLTFHEAKHAGERRGISRGIDAGANASAYTSGSNAYGGARAQVQGSAAQAGGANVGGVGAGAANNDAQNAAGFLMCHHCGKRFPMPSRCPECGSPYLRQLGPGTQYATDQLRKIVGPTTTIVRMDADTTRNKGDHERLLSEFAAADSGVLIGTQMIAKGLDFPDVTLAGVLIADTTLKLPDFRAAERTFQLVEQVAGRAGRANKAGRVIVQTYWPNHPAIIAASKHDRNYFLKEEMPMREELGYPPYKRLANILIWGKNEHLVAREAMNLRHKLDEHMQKESGANTLFAALRLEIPSVEGGKVAPVKHSAGTEDASLDTVSNSEFGLSHTPSLSYQICNMPPDNDGLHNSEHAFCEDTTAGEEDSADTQENSLEDWSVLGPSPCLLSKLRGTYRWHILIKAPPNSDIPAMLEPVLRRRKAVSGISVAVDVDPMDLF